MEIRRGRSTNFVAPDSNASVYKDLIEIIIFVHHARNAGFTIPYLEVSPEMYSELENEYCKNLMEKNREKYLLMYTPYGKIKIYQDDSR